MLRDYEPDVGEEALPWPFDQPSLLRSGGSPPLPVTRCVLVAAPLTIPDTILVTSDGTLPEVTLPLYGPPLAESAAHTQARRPDP